jgi:hypothetical protein
MQPEGSLLCLKQPATDPYPEPDESSPDPHSISQRSILILSTHVRLGLPTKTLYAFIISATLATWYAHLIVLELITLVFGEA